MNHASQLAIDCMDRIVGTVQVSMVRIFDATPQQILSGVSVVVLITLVWFALSSKRS